MLAVLCRYWGLCGRSWAARGGPGGSEGCPESREAPNAPRSWDRWDRWEGPDLPEGPVRIFSLDTFGGDPPPGRWTGAKLRLGCSKALGPAD